MKGRTSVLLKSAIALSFFPRAWAAPPLPLPPSSGEPVKINLPPPAPTPSSAPPEVPTQVTLAQVLEIALANNQKTKASWFAAQVAAAEVGRKRAAYFPSADVAVTLARQSQWAVGGRFGFQQTSYGPSLSLTYLLLDLGGRSARVEEAFQALLAADLAHNAAIQDVIYQVEEAYFGFLAASALQSAAEVSLRDAEKHLEAAQIKKEVGLAAALEVMQAQTAVAERKLELARLVGQVESVKGALATAMGFPATVAVNVAATLPEIDQLEAVRSVEDSVAQALASNPELQEARARERQAQAKLAATRAERLPALILNGSANRTYYVPKGEASFRDNWALSAAVRFPLFTGFERHFAEKKAEAEAQQAQVSRVAVEQKVTLDVWTAYYRVATAGARLQAARELLATATQTQEVAMARYREGVGSMLDLTQAQATLAHARAEAIEARAEYLLALAALARATGTLTPPPREAKGE